mmetsp:Transcript_130385/g.237111  ORF Transcript_130385/g.237111 Transcript_130385/m.237111 type:complete len:449 (+) Transcript_130385:107-1453(+)
MSEVMNTPEKCPEVAMQQEEAEVTPEKTAKVESQATEASRGCKRPTVPFFAFMNANRAKIMADHGLKKNSEVPKKAKELYDALSEEERKVYEQRYQEQKKAYEAFMATEEGQQFAKERKEAAKESKGSKKEPLMKKMKCKAFLKRALADKKCPVPKPQPAQFVFMNEKRQEIMKEYDLKSITEVSSKAKELYNALPDEERQAYEDRYQEQKKAFDAFKASPEGKQFFAEVKKVKTSVNKELEKKAEEKMKMEKKKAAVKKANPVKRPPTAFQQFLDERKVQIAADHGLKGAGEVQKKAQELFDALPPRERKIYETRYTQQLKAFESFKDAEKKALQEYKALVRKSTRMPKEPKEPKPPRKRAEKSTAPRAGKKAKTSAEAEVTVSPEVAAKAADMGLAESGVSYVRLLEKLLATPGLQGQANEERALEVLKKHGGNVNLSRNEMKGGA